MISIIMPAYNAEKTLEFAVRSVLAQTYRDFELIVINDCSKDRTVELILDLMKEDRRIRMLSNTRNSGVSMTRHNGVEAATGEWLAFLDSDDAWMPEKLEKQVELQNRTGANLIFTASSFMNADGEKIEVVLHAPKRIGYRRLLKQNLLSNSSVMIRKSLYQQYEVLGDNMHEDFACWLKVLQSGEIAHGIDEPLLIYRLSSESKSGNKKKAAKMNWNTYRAIGLNTFEAAYYQAWYMANGVLKYIRIAHNKRCSVEK